MSTSSVCVCVQFFFAISGAGNSTSLFLVLTELTGLYAISSVLLIRKQLPLKYRCCASVFSWWKCCVLHYDAHRACLLSADAHLVGHGAQCDMLWHLSRSDLVRYNPRSNVAGVIQLSQ